MKEHNTILNGSGKKFAIIASRFNELITSQLISGANDCLIRHGVDSNSIELFWVPGAFEIPYAAKRLAQKKEFDSIICLGAVIRGATSHFDYVASEVSKGIAALSLSEELPIIFGVLTTEDLEQALERAGSKAGNKGFDAAMTALEMANFTS